MKFFIYTQTTTTYAILMFLLLIIRVTNTYQILLFTEQTNFGKHYPPKLKAVHQCNSLKIKSKLGAVIVDNVRFDEDLLSMLVIFSLFSMTQYRQEAKLHRCKL